MADTVYALRARVSKGMCYGPGRPDTGSGANGAGTADRQTISGGGEVAGRAGGRPAGRGARRRAGDAGRSPGSSRRMAPGVHPHRHGQPARQRDRRSQVPRGDPRGGGHPVRDGGVGSRARQPLGAPGRGRRAGSRAAAPHRRRAGGSRLLERGSPVGRGPRRRAVRPRGNRHQGARHRPPRGLPRPASIRGAAGPRRHLHGDGRRGGGRLLRRRLARGAAARAVRRRGLGAQRGRRERGRGRRGAGGGRGDAEGAVLAAAHVVRAPRSRLAAAARRRR